MTMARSAVSVWHKVAAISGASAVGLAAYGAHAFKPSTQWFDDTFRRAQQQQFYHTLLLVAAPLARRPNVVGALATAGIILFSGSCYTVALTEDKTFGKGAPLGGFCMIAAWLALAL